MMVRGRTWAVPAAVALLSIVATAVAPMRLLDYERGGIAHGQAWRLVTGHLVHLDAVHLVLNVAALFALAWIFRPACGPARQLQGLAAGVVAVDGGLWFFHPDVQWYVGLSGALHAWFALGCVLWIVGADGTPSTRERAWGYALLAGLVVKLAIERLGPLSWNDASGWTVVTAAHRWGALGGVLLGLAIGLRRRTAVRARGEADRQQGQQ